MDEEHLICNESLTCVSHSFESSYQASERNRVQRPNMRMRVRERGEEENACFIPRVVFLSRGNSSEQPGHVTWTISSLRFGMQRSVPSNSFTTLRDVYALQQGTDTLCNAHMPGDRRKIPQVCGGALRCYPLSFARLFCLRLVITTRPRELIRTIGRLACS